MRKILAATTMLFAFFTQTNACDICGCGVGNINPHMFPHLSKNFISLSYNYRFYHTHLDHGQEVRINKETYHTVLLTGQYSPFKKLQLMGMLPYQLNRQTGHHGNKSLNKVGDAVLLGNYRAMDIYAGKTKKIRHTLLLGAGVKLPTGEYVFDEENEKDVHNANFQAGTGSADLLLNGFYNVRIKNWMFSTGMTYKMNGSNKKDYQFGNRFLTVVQAKFIQNTRNFSLIPNAGINYENMKLDKSNGETVAHTGGNNTQLTTGLDINTNKWAVGFTWLQPLKQDLGEGQIHAMPGWNIHLSLSF